MVRVITLLALLAAPTTEEAPLEFRCDGMEVLRSPNRTICRGNVVARQADLLICCDQFEALADDQWQWTSLRCENGVRARRGDERMWSQRADIDLKGAKLTLTGKPWLERGSSLLQGSQIVVTLSGDHAVVNNPRGIVADAKSPAPPSLRPLEASGALPATCPISKAPTQRVRP
jgi:lipopolysaccharide export system protein LptA